jgi:hypothetical protein
VEAGVKYLQGDPGGRKLGVRHAQEMRRTLASELDKARDLVRPFLQETDYNIEARVWIFFIDSNLEPQLNRHLDEWEAIFNRAPDREQMLRRNFLDRSVLTYTGGIFEPVSAARSALVFDLLNLARGHRELATRAAIYRAASWAGTRERFWKEEIDRARREVALSRDHIDEAIQAIEKERAKIEHSEDREGYPPNEVLLAELDAFERAGKTDLEFLTHLMSFTNEENFASFGPATRLIQGPAWQALYDRMLARDLALINGIEALVGGTKTP